MAISKVIIYNLALAHIGESASVVSPDEESEEVHACEAFYPIAKAKMLELHDWSFASRTQVLAELAGIDTYGWIAGYALPSGCTRVQYVREHLDPITVAIPRFLQKDWDYEVRFNDTSKVLYTNCPTPLVGYMADVNEAYFSPSFADALAWLLATYISGERIKGKEGASFASSCQQQFARSLAEAKTLDGHQLRNRSYRFVPNWIRGR